MSELPDRSIKARRESKSIDFKRSFDVQNEGEWCELIKDIVAMANSGGGIILIGVENNGALSGFDVTSILALDSATVSDKLSRYTGNDLCDVVLQGVLKNDQLVAGIEIAGVRTPIVFLAAGSYTCDRKPKSAFARGTVYFRHGAKSEPGTTQDLRLAIDKQVESLRNEWLANVRKVVQAPRGAIVSVLSGKGAELDAPGARIRLVKESDAQGYKLVDPDKTHPHRQKELINVVNHSLPNGMHINSRDVLAVRNTLGINDDPTYCYKSKFGTRQYSDEFARLLIAKYSENANFFFEARSAYFAMSQPT